MQQSADIHQLAGEAFVNEWFYKVMDSTRLVVSGFYKADSRLVYLGNAVVGDQAISDFLKALPPTKHHIETLDVQAVPVPNVDTLSSNILVSVGGRVVFGDSVSKQVGWSGVALSAHADPAAPFLSVPRNVPVGARSRRRNGRVVLRRLGCVQIRLKDSFAFMPG
jgi:hypothetical protein